MKINPDLFQSAIKEGMEGIGAYYPHCPVNEVCFFVDNFDEPLKKGRCEFFQEPPEGEREPICLWRQK